ncbi:NHL domain-containing protein [Bacteroides faecium]|uniref:IPT/TIG domain-containing protein n=1 Tax=Bacteroides faecium TaxID=2715212 RepID=A0A6H0KM52_9BACE|nr:IPT/TIG domain-containing protein [Bacteroides faecium]QIU93447.1 hypothetical protein BacF7301_04435 [Bacteroides faecium]
MALKEHIQAPLRKRLKRFCLYSLLFPLCFSCKDSDSTEEQFNPNNPVEVTAIIPKTGAVALPLVIHGKNFGNDKSKIKVLFDDVQAQVITAKNEHLYILNPRQTGGEHTVKVIVEDKEGILNEKFDYIVTSSVSTVAGSGEYNDNDGSALEASFPGPEYLSVDDKGNIFNSEYNGRRLRLISLNERKVTTLIENGDVFGSYFSPDYSTLYIGIESSSTLANELDCTSSFIKTVIPNTLEMKYGAASAAVDSQGNVYYIGYAGAIAKKDIKTGKLAIIGEIPEELVGDYSGIDYYAAYNPKDNHVYISSRKTHIIFRFDASQVSLENGDFELYAGIFEHTGHNNGDRLQATFDSPKGMAFDSKGMMYIADTNNNVIRIINSEGKVSTFIGNSEGGYKDGSLEEALFYHPYDVTISPDDFIYVADYGNHRIRCIAIQ